MRNLLSSLCNSIKPYKAGEQPKDKTYIKLNTNENPYPPSPEVKKVINGFDADTLRLYPDPESVKLKTAISEKECVGIKNIFVGNGSDEVLALCFPTFFDAKAENIVFPDITYSFYPVYCDFFNINYKEINLDNDFSIKADDYYNLKDVQGIIIANPNAPTGRGLDTTIIESIVKTNSDKIVIIDEAYMDFYKKSAVILTKKYKNLLVVKTFSKSYSLAGIRCGYAIGDESLIDGLNRCKNSFNSYPIDRICESVCHAAIKDINYYDKVNEMVINEREFLSSELNKAGFYVIPSDSNFIFAKHKNISGKDLYLKLKKSGILVRHFEKQKITDFVRITIGTKSQNKTFLSNLKVILTELI